jgi:hypothetical protein
MNVAAAAKAVMMALLQSHTVRCTSRPAASMYTRCFNECYNGYSSTRASSSSRLLSPAGTAVAQRELQHMLPALR